MGMQVALQRSFLVALGLSLGLLAACGGGQVRRVSDPAANIQQLTVQADGNFERFPGISRYIADTLARGRSIHYHLQGTLVAAPEKGGTKEYEVERDNALSPVPGVTGVLR